MRVFLTRNTPSSFSRHERDGGFHHFGAATQVDPLIVEQAVRPCQSRAVVVVPSDDDDGELGLERAHLTESLANQLNGLLRRSGSIEHVAGDHQQIVGFAPQMVSDPRQSKALVFVHVAPTQRLAEVRIGRVQKRLFFLLFPNVMQSYRSSCGTTSWDMNLHFRCMPNLRGQTRV